KDTSLLTKLKYSNYTRSLWANKGRGQSPTGNVTQTNPYPVQTLSLAPPRGADEETLAFQSDFNKTAKAWDMEHTLLAGVEYYREHVYRYSFDTTGCQPAYSPSNTGWITVNNNNLVRDLCTQGYANLVKNNSTVFSYASNSYAVYGQDMVELTRGVKVMGGFRNDWLNAVYNQPNSSTGLKNQALDFSAQSYRAGLLYEPMPNFGNFYLSWSDSFSPTADLYQLSAGAQLPAETSELTEIGYKGDINDLGLSFRASLYHQVKNYERNTDLESTAQLRSVRRHTDGVEFEVTGSLTEKWDVFSGLGLMDSRIDIPANPLATQMVGQTPSNATPYTFNLWTTYQLPYGWKIGGGVNGMGRRNVYGQTGAAYNAPNWVQAQATVDGLIQYDAKNYTVRLNGYNLFNTTNYVSLYENGGFAVPGTYQAFQLGLTYKF
ncbi:MAG: ligand-gated channel, partial [Pseudomonadota bacterium]